MIRYLPDENVPVAYRTELHRQNPTLEVRVIGDEDGPRKRTPDPDILIWCEENGFTLVTSNRHSMPGHLADHLAQGRHIPGILTFKDKERARDVIEWLLLMAGAAFEKEYWDQMAYFP